MEIETRKKVRSTGYLVMTAGLTLICGGLLWVIGITAKIPPDTGENVRQLMGQLAVVAAATLGLTLLILLWVIIRWIRWQIRTLPRGPKMTYVNAWEEAGRRLKVPDEDDG